ncbi:MAG: ATP-binding cassette domain-containing protein [Candidatus Omnitrophota bacterium]
MNCIEVQDLWVEFERPILKGVNFRVEEGKNTVIVGASGVGKTVLLKTVLGLIRQQQGKIFIQGKETTLFSRGDWTKARREIGMVFQGNALFDSISTWENVGFYLLEHSDLSQAEIRKEASRVLSLVGLKGVEDLKPDKLSGGMKKRVALARSLISSAQIILFDEPTAGLDPIAGESIENLILDLQKKLGTTVLVVTHDRNFTLRVANHIGLLSDGKIIGFAPVSEIKANKNSPVYNFFRPQETDFLGVAEQ